MPRARASSPKHKKSMKKRRGRAAARRIEKVTTTRTSTKFFVKNPVDMDILNDIAPAFGAYAATRLLSRMALVQIGKRWPGLAKHAQYLAAGAGFAATWLLGNKVQPVARWHQPITVGAAIAALQSVAQGLLPQYAWIVSDCDIGQYCLPPGAPLLTPVQPQAEASASATGEYDDDYGFEDEQAAGAPPVTDDTTDDQGVDEDLDTGIFSNEGE